MFVSYHYFVLRYPYYNLRCSTKIHYTVPETRIYSLITLLNVIIIITIKYYCLVWCLGQNEELDGRVVSARRAITEAKHRSQWPVIG
jgi:hypothetical protein